VGAHRLAPAHYVIAAPAAGVFGLEHDPAVDGENAFPAAGAAGEYEESCIAVGVRRRQHADARPISIAETGGTVLAGIERRVNRKGKKEEDENSGQHFSNGGAHGFRMRPGFRTEIWRVPPRLHNGDAAYRHIKSTQRVTKASPWRLDSRWSSPPRKRGGDERGGDARVSARRRAQPAPSPRRPR